MFEKDWSHIEREVRKRIKKAIVHAANKTYSVIIDRTPYGRPELWKYPAAKDYNPGTLRASWEIDFGHGFKKAISGYSQKLDNFQAGLEYRLGDDIWVRNQEPYANRVEHGWSSQAPRGMTRVTINEYSRYLDEAVKKYRF